MAVHKNKAIKKTSKKAVKEHKAHKVVEKKPEEEKKPQPPEVHNDAPVPPKPPISENVGGPVVIPSPQSEPELPKVVPSVPVSQPTPQVADTLVSQVSQPASAANNIPSVEPIATQNPFTVDGVVRDKPEQEHVEEPKKKRPWVIIGLIIVGIVLIGGVLWYFRENASKQVALEDSATSTPSPLKVTPTPASDSAKLVIDYSKYKIKILNGSGIGGAAAKGKEILEEEKFVVEEIGNAETSDYEKTVIQAKKEVPSAFLDKLKSVLGETYIVGSNEKLEESEEVDVVIIIGSSKQPQN